MGSPCTTPRCRPPERRAFAGDGSVVATCLPPIALGPVPLACTPAESGVHEASNRGGGDFWLEGLLTGGA